MATVALLRLEDIRNKIIDIANDSSFGMVRVSTVEEDDTYIEVRADRLETPEEAEERENKVRQEAENKRQRDLWMRMHTEIDDATRKIKEEFKKQGLKL